MSMSKRCAAVGAAALALALVLAIPAAAAVSQPPTIGQLNGTVWGGKMSGTGYYLLSGGKEKIKGVGFLSLTQVDPDILRIDLEGEDSLYGRYYSGSGVLVVGELDDPDLATDLYCGYIIFSGAPGKMKATGEVIEYETVSDGEAEAIKISAKQLLIQ